MRVLIVNYKRHTYVSAFIIMLAFKSCYNIDLYGCCRI